MAFEYDYLEKIDTTFTVATSYYKTIPKSRYKPKTNCLLIPKIYVNCSYSLPAGSTVDGRLRINMMREDPEDETFYFDLELPRGRDVKLDTKLELKRWPAEDLGRYVHFEAKAYGVSKCYLNASTYIAFAEIR
jgi:hypothetical protein